MLQGVQIHFQLVFFQLLWAYVGDVASRHAHGEGDDILGGVAVSSFASSSERISMESLKTWKIYGGCWDFMLLGLG